MEMTARQLIAAQQALVAIGRKPVKITGAVRVAKALQELTVAASVIDERRRALLDQYAVKDKSGKLITDEAGNATFADSNQDAFAAGYGALLDEEITIEVSPVAVADLGEIEIAPEALAPLVAVGLVG